MPSDHEISGPITDQFIQVLQLLEEQPTEDSIPLLLGTVGRDTGLGMYEHIRFVLQKLPATLVAPHLVRMLNHEESEVRCRVAFWAMDCPCQMLVGPLLKRRLSETNEDVLFALDAALEACSADGL